MLEDCYPEIICDPDARFRNIDGTCNNLEDPILGKVNIPFNKTFLVRETIR